MKGFKNVVFWAHLVCAIPAAVFILIMSVTAVALTYEAQMVESAGERNFLAAVPAGEPLGLDQLAAANPIASRNAALIVSSDPTAPLTLSAGREGSKLFNAYTGAEIEDQAQGTREFMATMERWHRYLAQGGRESTGAFLIKASNLIFLFLVVSGIYIWLPDVYRWVQFKGRMLFNKRNVNSKARDYNWHHVFSFWALIPIAVMALSGVVMSYEWANNLLFAAYGESAPQRGGPPGGPGGPVGPGGEGMGPPPGEGPPMEGGFAEGMSPPMDSAAATVESAPAVAAASLQSLLATAKSQLGNWKTISIPMNRSGETVTLTAELHSESERGPRQSLVLSNLDGAVISVGQPAAMGPPGGQQSGAQRARGWMRFAHTGEEYGVIGQTIAGLGSLAAIFLVYTGLALAYRRLIVPLFRRQSQSIAS